MECKKVIRYHSFIACRSVSSVDLHVMVGILETVQRMTNPSVRMSRKDEEIRLLLGKHMGEKRIMANAVRFTCGKMGMDWLC